MKVPIKDLKGQLLNFAVCEIEKRDVYLHYWELRAYDGNDCDYVNSWELTGSIITREYIHLRSDGDYWYATWRFASNGEEFRGRTAIIAALRCYIGSFNDLTEDGEIDIAEELS